MPREMREQKQCVQKKKDKSSSSFPLGPLLGLSMIRNRCISSVWLVPNSFELRGSIQPQAPPAGGLESHSFRPLELDLWAASSPVASGLR